MLEKSTLAFKTKTIEFFASPPRSSTSGSTTRPQPLTNSPLTHRSFPQFCFQSTFRLELHTSRTSSGSGRDSAMQGSKTKSGLAEAKRNSKAEAKGNDKGTPPTPKGGKTSKPAVPKATAAYGTPLSVPRVTDKSPGSADRKTPKSVSRITTPPTEKQGKTAKPPQEPHATKPSQELQAQLVAVQKELKKAKERLMEKEEKG